MRFPTLAIVMLFAAGSWSASAAPGEKYTRDTSPVSTVWMSTPSLLQSAARALKKGDLETGIRKTRQALKLHMPGLARMSAVANLCAAYSMLRETDETVDFCSQAISFNSRNWWAYNNRGTAYQLQGKHEKAAADYLVAAEHEVAEAQSNLGALYAYGTGVNQDHDAALKWFLRAVANGDPAAAHNLGVLYDQGQGVAQDFPEAARWFRQAAKQGNVDSQANFGIMLALGQGVERDFIEAYKWLRLALRDLDPGDEDNEASEMLRAVEIQLDKNQLSEARRRVQTWKIEKS